MNMTIDREESQKKHGHRHLTLLELITIAEAVQRGEKVAAFKPLEKGKINCPMVTQRNPFHLKESEIGESLLKSVNN